MSASSKPRLVAADDDPTIRNLIAHFGAREGFEVVTVPDGEAALRALGDDTDVLLLDAGMPGPDGHEVLRRTIETHPGLPVVMLTATKDVTKAVAAIKAGADNYLCKPFNPEELFRILRKAAELGRTRRENTDLRQSVTTAPVTGGGLVGDSPAMGRLREQLTRVAALDSTLLLTGESGTGKTLAAREIHHASPRAKGPFITVSCPAIPRELLESELFGHEKGAFTGATQRRIGKIEMAAGGTLFLDEIGDLPPDLQPKLLNVLQDRVFTRVGDNKPIRADIRLIAATNADLASQVRAGRFREDLYYRLCVIPLDIPPLRERVVDIAPLARAILTAIGRRRGGAAVKLGGDALRRLEGYPWPGNVRQLENTLERASAFCAGGVIAEADLPPEIRAPADARAAEAAGGAVNLAGLTLAEIERLALIRTLDATGGNRAKAGRLLGVSEKTVYNLMHRYGLAAPSPVESAP